ncbi:hypothetical protein P154DRAFT_62036 [Amniculicola lignicola CBS 123094]|uniref:Mid2 domain-containing protein n=1 Tax=Amniculicola lignicola CBS 123094 TaxID=1392246 RepID=A0A6A5VYB3_9PLEO|nr:hypothetical protein P154DRAFT_62036 [Amniculicola lignicola CBS 123094]
MASLVLTLLLLLRGTAVLAAGQTCYGLDGSTLDSSYASCKSSGTQHSGCCATNRSAGSADICLGNGLCMATNDVYMGTIWQNGCTDPTGQDEGCPRLCPDARDNFEGLNQVPAWNIQMCDFGSYCCRAAGDRGNCCNNATAPKATTTLLGAFVLPTTASKASAAAATISSAGSNQVTPSPEPSSIFATAVSTGKPFEISTTATPTPQPAATCKKDKSAMVGGAVGGTLSAIILGLIGLLVWFWRREKHQRKMKEHYEEQFGQNFAWRRTLIIDSDSRDISRVPTAAPSEKTSAAVVTKPSLK